MATELPASYAAISMDFSIEGFLPMRASALINVPPSVSSRYDEETFANTGSARPGIGGQFLVGMRARRTMQQVQRNAIEDLHRVKMAYLRVMAGNDELGRSRQIE